MRIIMLYGQKAGGGKTTMASALALAAQHAGVRVALADLSGGEGGVDTLNKARTEAGLTPITVIKPPRAPGGPRFTWATQAFDQIRRSAENYGADLLIVDTGAGRETFELNAAAGVACDILVTPLLDSPLDLYSLARGDDAPSVSRFLRAAASHRDDDGPTWVVVRNRTPHLATRLGGRIAQRLAEQAHAFGYRCIEGLKDRVAYREMFDTGRSPLDGPGDNRAPTPGHIAARAEVERLAESFGLRRLIAAEAAA
jgi:chromosome partitioning protein